MPASSDNPTAREPGAFRTHIGSHDVAALASGRDTPFFVYDAAAIRQRIAELGAFDVVRYAQKACSNIAVLDLCRRHGVLVDATSAGEVTRALRAGYGAGGEPPEIVYTADIFDRESLDLIVELGVHVNCGSPDMIRQYGERVGSGAITLRLNPGFGHGHSQKTNTGGDQSKHGIWHTDLADAVAMAKSVGLEVSGIHVHIGSGADMEHLSEVCGAVERLARTVGPSIHTVSGGGGLPIPYEPGEERVSLDEHYRLWRDTQDRLAADFGHPVSLEIEPGRYIVAESGYLVTEIRAIKTMGANTFYVVDAGFNNLARPVLYGAYHPMSVVAGDGRRSDGDVVDVVVGGPLCESGDIFTQREGGYVRTQGLPRAAVGDYLVIECAGAYGASMGSNYNSKPLAAELLIDGPRVFEVRARQTSDDLVRGESIPDYDS